MRIRDRRLCFDRLLALCLPLFVFTSHCVGQSTEHLRTVRIADFGDMGKRILASPMNHTIHICGEHFDSTSRAGRQVDLTIKEVNRIEGCSVKLIPVRKGISHFDAFDLFPKPAPASIFDYVDVEKPMPKKGGLPNDLTFAMRTCRFDLGPRKKVRHFTIMAKSTNYGHFKDPKSKNYPMKRGVLHELAHAFGMNHAKAWSPENRHLISTMQGHLRYLSALDVGYLRHFYPDPTAKAHCNIVVSSTTRFDSKKAIFADDNPKQLFVDKDGKLKDLKTGEAPVIQVAWFNTGNQDAPVDTKAINRLYLRHARTDRVVELHQWRIASMPSLSQDQWRGPIVTPVGNNHEDITGNWLLTFEVNADESWQELTREDNRIAYPVVIRK